jgi:hypothetical protein
MRWGVPKQKRHCTGYCRISHQVIIVQNQKDFVINVGQVIYQHRHDSMRMDQEVSSIRPIGASPTPSQARRNASDLDAVRRHPGLNVAPERDQQLPPHSHDGDPPRALR